MTEKNDRHRNLKYASFHTWNETGIRGNRQKALQELFTESKYNKISEEVIRATMERTVYSSTKSRHYPDDYFTVKELARSEVAKTGGYISDCRLKGICVQSAMRHLYLDSLSQTKEPRERSLGVESSCQRITCHNCGNQRLCGRNCYKDKAGRIGESSVDHGKQKGRKSSRGKRGSTGTGAQK